MAFGPLGFSFGSADRLAFDISGASGAAFASLNGMLYGVNLTTGAASQIGSIGGNNVQGVTGLTAGAVPEPASWAMLITGFGLIGTTMRRRTARLAAA